MNYFVANALGATAIEYILIAALISLVIVTALGSQMANLYCAHRLRRCPNA